MSQNTPSLAELQRWMRWIITDPRGVSEALSEKSKKRRDCREWIEDVPPIPREKRLDIYAEGYFLRLVETLGEDFETVRRALGPSHFKVLVADYLKAFPSRFPNINQVGFRMAEFIQDHQASEDLPFLVDLAHLEWSVLNSFLAKDMAPFDPKSLEGISDTQWMQAKFTLDASVHLLECAWAVDETWLKRDKPDEEFRIPAIPSARRLLIYRMHDFVEVENAPIEKYSVLQMFQQGKTLGQVCEKMENYPILDSFGTWLGEWVSRGILRKIEIGS